MGGVAIRRRCIDGAWLPCDDTAYATHSFDYQAGTETSCDGLDNDCETDDDFYFELWDGAYAVGPAQPCGTGACAGGQTQCNDSFDGLLCSTADQASGELCANEVDEDCDGETDEADCTP